MCHTFDSETHASASQVLRRYFFTRNMSSIVAFAVGGKYAPGNGVYMVGAHTDSPCLKVKPKSKGVKAGHAMLNVETYGGGLWTTWFDRDLSVAGRLLVRGNGGELQHKLVWNSCRSRLMIPAVTATAERPVHQRQSDLGGV